MSPGLDREGGPEGDAAQHPDDRGDAREPRLLDRLLDRMVEICAETLRLEIDAGADCVQIFDTWAGMLSARRFERFAGQESAS